MAVHLCVLASGSSGNVTAIWNEDTGILIDCGCSRSYIETALQELRMTPSLLKAVLVTHGHSDHISASAVALCRSHRIPLYMHPATVRAVGSRRGMEKFARADEGLVRQYAAAPFDVAGFSIEPFAAYHRGGSAGETFGFCVSWQSAGRVYRIGYLTDTGKTDDAMAAKLRNCNALVLEANHDPDLVRSSARHFLNKQWVLSDYGHLCNRDAARLIAQVKRDSDGQDTLKYVFLAHISRDHNTVETAVRQVTAELCLCQSGAVRLLPTWHRRKSAVLKIQ